ncbi:sensor histidine kinase [Neobacillus mesonae]|uniref:ATP-binding protein n=1 Tax=Neobacillus mesonae TaxID=1193713 RepID=UPI00203FD354|nr:sensor histidine kinase [Neobacillus mesonae]MCM3570375.1 sensor histidine kinase [Neobacillus mesonae]
MENCLKVSLQTKILVLIFSLLLFVIIFLSVFFSYYESKQTEEQMGQMALLTAKTVSFMPTIRNAFMEDNPSKTIQPIVEHIRKDVGAEFIVVGNKEKIRYSHPDESKIGKKMVGGDSNKAIDEGKYYTSKAKGSLGPSLRGKAPIFDYNGNIIGILSVGFMIDDIKQNIIYKWRLIGAFAFIALCIGALGAVLLSRNIRKDTLGLEPWEIASLYRERNAILSSVKEGIVAVDDKGMVTMLNQSAKDILGLTDDAIHQPIENIIKNTHMYRVIKSGKVEQDQEMILLDRAVIVSRTPIMEKNRVVGVVASFRDKLEMREMINTLSEVRKYAEELRAQTHEYSNKLYVISGLLQLGEYKEAIEMIQQESRMHQDQNRLLFEQICDKKVQAILLGKISKASEQKITFVIDENSSLEELPRHIGISNLAVILGNIIDNAFEAVANREKKEVSIFATDMGNDVVFEITDSGDGINPANIEKIFTRGFSTKTGKNRGYGLASAWDAVKELNGYIEVQNLKNGGSVFTIFLPKI